MCINYIIILFIILVLTILCIQLYYRCLPLNFIEDDLNKGVLRDRMRIGSSLADIDPMTIDKAVSNVKFNKYLISIN